MAGNILQQSYVAAAATALSTELNSLADGSVSALSAEIDNTTNLSMVLDAQLDLASLTISSSAAYCTLYVVPTVDGTSYPDWTSGAKAGYHDQYAVATIRLKAVSATTARANVARVDIPPGKFKLAIGSALGVGMASASNTLKYRTYAASYT